MDTEEQAINDLTSMIYSQEAPQGEAPAEEAAPEPTTTEAPAKDPEAEIKIDVAKLFAEQTKIIQEQAKKLEELTKQQEQPPVPTEEEMMIEQARQKIGMTQEMFEMAAKYKEQKELEGMIATFKKSFPEIELKEMGEFAEANGMMNALNSKDINQWGLVAQAMRITAKPVAKPDSITPTAQKGAETTVWDRLKKREDVSDTEFGAELLKFGNAL